MLLLFSGGVFAEPSLTTSNALENQLPSEKALESIEVDKPMAVSPGTRARPGDIGDNENAQKIPFGSPGSIELTVLFGVLFLYGVYRRKVETKQIKNI